jgi:hypothetical protein
MIKPASELISELRELGAVQILEPDDDRYYLPSREWVRQFLAWLHPQIQSTLAKLPPGHRGFDCDNIVRRVRDRATDFLIQNGDIPPDCDHAIFSSKVAISAFAENGLNGIKRGATAESHETAIIRTADAGWIFGEVITNQIRDALDAANSGDVPRIYRVGL